MNCSLSLSYARCHGNRSVARNPEIARCLNKLGPPARIACCSSSSFCSLGPEFAKVLGSNLMNIQRVGCLAEHSLIVVCNLPTVDNHLTVHILLIVDNPLQTVGSLLMARSLRVYSSAPPYFAC